MVAADHSQTLLASVLRVMLHALNTNQVPYSRSFLICWKKDSWCSWSFFDPLENSLLICSCLFFQSTNFLQHLFAVQRSLVSKWVLVHRLIIIHFEAECRIHEKLLMQISIKLRFKLILFFKMKVSQLALWWSHRALRGALQVSSEALFFLNSTGNTNLGRKEWAPF